MNVSCPCFSPNPISALPMSVPARSALKLLNSIKLFYLLLFLLHRMLPIDILIDDQLDNPNICYHLINKIYKYLKQYL